MTDACLTSHVFLFSEFRYESCLLSSINFLCDFLGFNLSVFLMLNSSNCCY